MFEQKEKEKCTCIVDANAVFANGAWRNVSCIDRWSVDSDGDGTADSGNGTCDSHAYISGDYCNGNGHCGCIDIDGSGDCDCIDYNGDGKCEFSSLAGSLNVWNSTKDDRQVRMAIEDNFMPLNKIVLSAKNPLPGEEPMNPTAVHHNLAVTDLRIPQGSCNVDFLSTYYRAEDSNTWWGARNGYFGMRYDDIQCTVTNWGNEQSEAFDVEVTVTNLDTGAVEACNLGTVPWLDSEESTGENYMTTLHWADTSCAQGLEFERDERYRVNCTVIPNGSAPQETNSEIISNSNTGCIALENLGMDEPYFCDYGSDRATYDSTNGKTVEFKAVLNANVVKGFSCTGSAAVKPTTNINGHIANAIAPIIAL